MVRGHDKAPTCLREAATAKAGNAAGGPFSTALCTRNPMDRFVVKTQGD
jgi:hypothetical protein